MFNFLKTDGKGGGTDKSFFFEEDRPSICSSIGDEGESFSFLFLSPRRSSFESARVARSTDSRAPPMGADSSTTPGSRCCSRSGSPSACSTPSSRWARASPSSGYPRSRSTSSPSCTSPARPPGGIRDSA